MSGDRSPLVRDVGTVTPTRWDDPVRGTLSFRTLFSGDVTPTAGLTTGVAELGARERLAVHRHPPDEVYYVIEGTGVVTLADREHAVGPGSSVFIPGGVAHGVRSTGTGLLRLFYALTADRLDDVAYDFGV
jgi:mannose-6-phosphate isomerase-like protein (cupin superfamily)